MPFMVYTVAVGVHHYHPYTLKVFFLSHVAHIGVCLRSMVHRNLPDKTLLLVRGRDGAPPSLRVIVIRPHLSHALSVYILSEFSSTTLRIQIRRRHHASLLPPNRRDRLLSKVSPRDLWLSSLHLQILG